MIFVTVGAYDLPFDRLVRGVNELVAAGVFDEEVFVQIGHSAVPRSDLRFERFLAFDRMNEYADQARIIISQGGPGSIMLALARGKIPIVVPRQHRYGEMVDDHQVLFVRKLVEEKKVLAVFDIADLAGACLHYDERIVGLQAGARDGISKAAAFCDEVERLILDHRARKGKKGRSEAVRLPGARLPERREPMTSLPDSKEQP